VGGECVPRSMHDRPLGDPRRAHRPLDRALQRLLVQVMTPPDARARVAGRPGRREYPRTSPTIRRRADTCWRVPRAVQPRAILRRDRQPTSHERGRAGDAAG
jgi:hypothetical protein